MKIRVDGFTGMAPKIAPHLLPNSAGQEASNVKLISGSLKPVNTPVLESNKMIASALSVYMLGAPGSAIPLSWATDVDVVASPVSDSEYRVYYTGDSVPRKTTLTLANTGLGPFPAAWYLWGVPAPAAAPSSGGATSAGNVPAGTWVYVYTHVTQFGTTLLEESAPSPTYTVTVGVASQIPLTLPNPASLTNRNYVYKRIYRSNGTAFQMVAQIATATTAYTDNLSATAIAGDALLTTGWLPPDDNLKGVCALPSGGLVAFKNNEVWFSEPGYPHAWPAAYMQALDSQIVGIKTYGNTVVVATQGFPYAGSGVHPDSFTFRKLPFLEPCLAKRSMAADEFGVIYASSNGLVAVGDDANGVISAAFLSRDSFVQYAPDTFSACVFERRYYGFYDSATYGQGALVFARNDPSPLSTMSTPVRGVMVDQKTARMLIISKDDGFLYQFDPTSTVPYTYSWKSKLFEAPGPVNLSCFRVTGSETSASDAAFAAALAAANAAIVSANATIFGTGALNMALNDNYLNQNALNGSNLTPLIPAVSQTIGVTIYAGRNQVMTGDFAFNTVYRMPSGFRTMGWEVKITGQREVMAIELATSPQELING